MSVQRVHVVSDKSVYFESRTMQNIISFLAHLRRRLKWAFLITICPSSVVVVVVVNVLLFFIFFSRPTGPISIKLSTKNCWVVGIQVCWNQMPGPLPKGNDYEIAKIIWRNLKIFSPRTTGPISTKLGTKAFFVGRIQVYSNEGPTLFQGELIKK